MDFLHRLFSLKNRTALITGARTGIGQAIAYGMAQAGAETILLGHQGDMRETENLIISTGQRPVTITVDLSVPDQIPTVFEEVLGHRPIDVLVNNAGIIRREEATEYRIEDWNETLAVNLTAAFQLTQYIGRNMVKRRAGKVIQIASLLSFQGGIQVAAYTASKHGLVGLTRALANEWGAKGVQVNAIAPGYILTNNTQPLRNDPQRTQEIEQRIPIHRWGTPEDIVGAAIFLASPASNYVNGHVLVVDGGWLTR